MAQASSRPDWAPGAELAAVGSVDGGWAEPPPRSAGSGSLASSGAVCGSRSMALFTVLMGLGAHVRAQALRRRREVVGLTQEEAAHLAGISISTWSNLENPAYQGFRPRSLRKALRALQVPEEHQVRADSSEEIVSALTALPFHSGGAAGSAGPGEGAVTGPAPQSAGRSRVEEIAGQLRDLDEQDLEVVAGLVSRLRGGR